MTELFTTDVDVVLDEFSIEPPVELASKQPDISHLPPAVRVIDGVTTFMAAVNDKVVGEVYAPSNGQWLVTQVGKVQYVDHVTGNFGCFDETRCRQWGGNYKKNDTYRLLPFGQKLEKRVRRSSLFAKPKVEPKPEGEKKRGRGRPKGVKNRPKEIIAAERAKLAKVKAAKRAARMAERRKGRR